MYTDSTNTWSNARTAFFTAGSHVAIMLSICVGAIVTAKSSDAEFNMAIVVSVLSALEVFVTSAVIISFFSSSIAAQSGGNSVICATGPAVGNVISYLLIALFISIILGESFPDIVEVIFVNGAIIASICTHLSVASLGTMLTKIG